MLESIINPKRTEKGPFKMFFVGLIYATLSLLLVKLFFSGNPILYKYAGILVVTFSVMFSLPFMYFLFKKEEEEDEQIEGFFSVWKMHSDAVYAFMWLFLGFIVAFAFINNILHDPALFNAQVQTYCSINSPGNVDSCISKNSLGFVETGAVTKEMRFLSVISNNIYVMLFTLLFSLIFGAGAIFILAWNASVIASAIGIFTSYNWEKIPLGLARYMIHGSPEIIAYFITALAGGIFGVSAIRNGVRSRIFLRVSENAIMLLFIALIFLIIAGLIEVYFTPLLFN